MIKKLRRKFIIVSMLSITIVLILIIGIINISNYIGISKRVEPLLMLISDNNGQLIFNNLPEDSPNQKHPPGFSPETPFNTRFFSVILNSEGKVLSTNTKFISALTKEDASSYAINIYKQNSKDGFYNNFKYKVVDNNNEILITFLDCNREFDTFYSFLWSSAFISLVGIVLVYVLVLILSRFSLKPIAESYEKQKRFITDASHEIKTPLTIIDANTEVLEMTSGDNEWTQSIRNQVKRLSGLSSNLVTLSKMDEKKSNLVMVSFSLSDAVSESIEQFKIIAQKQSKIFSIDIEKNISFTGNETQIRQLVTIFNDNAMKYSILMGRLSFL